MRARLVRGLGLIALCCSTAALAAVEAAPADGSPLAAPPAIPIQGVWEVTPTRLLQQVLARNADALYARLQARVASRLLEAESALGEPVGYASLRHEDRFRQRTAQELNATNPLYATQNNLDELVDTLEIGVRERLATGGEVSLSYRYTDRRNNIIRTTTGNSAEYDGALTLTLKHPLLRGYGTAAVDADRQVAELEQAIGLQQYKQQLLKASSDALTAYWQLYKAHELKRMREEARDHARRAFDDARAQVASGRASRTVASESQALLGLRTVEVLRAEQGVSEAEARMKNLLGLPGHTYAGLSLKPAPGEVAAAPSAEVGGEALSDTRLNAVLEAWPPWQVAQLRRRQAQVRLDYARNQVKPALDVIASCSSSRLAYSSGEVTDNVLSTRYPDCYLGLNLEMPLQGNRRAGAQHEAQQLRIAQSDLELDAVRGAMANDLLSRQAMLANAMAEVEEMRRDVDLRARLLDAERVQMELGLSRLAQVIERENALNESRARLLESLTRQEQARTALHLADGSLLQRHAIELGE